MKGVLFIPVVVQLIRLEELKVAPTGGGNVSANVSSLRSSPEQGHVCQCPTPYLEPTMDGYNRILKINQYIYIYTNTHVHTFFI